MNNWFKWNGVSCIQYGIYVTELPPPTIPAERVTHTNVPGRAGSLTTLEGDYVYDDVVLSCTCVISDLSKIPAIAGWLRGSGTVTFADREGGDVHRNDGMQEALSLSERFGMTILFARPNPQLYLQIVRELAEKNGVQMPQKELETKAEAFALARGTRSARCAEQFINSLL